MDIYSFLTMICGLAFFLFGMSVMSVNLEKMAGGSLEGILKKVTSNKFLSLTLGIVITAVVQSSSAVTVMLVGLVNSGIIDFAQTISVVLGTNVGTTLTGWIMTLMGVSTDEFTLFSLASPKVFVPVLAFIGALMRTFSKKEKTKDIGTIMLGFSVLMYGMTIMSSSMSALTELPGFKSLLTMFTNPLLALLAATIFTGIIQSSSAAIGIFQALALNGALNFQMAVPMVLGANIGTTVTAILSAVGSNKSAKRVVFSHLFVNLVGAAIMMVLFSIYCGINPVFVASTTSEVGIAIIHTAFNLFNVLLFFPTQNLLVKIIEKLIPSTDDEKQVFLDERLLTVPSTAVNECVRLSNEMAYIAEESVLKALSLLKHFSEDVAKTIEVDEDELDKYEDELSTFLVKLAKTAISESDAEKIGRIQHSITNFERLGDHALNIHDTIIKVKKEGNSFGAEAMEELTILTTALAEIMDMALLAYTTDDLKVASLIEPLEETIDNLVAQCQDNHVARLVTGECSLTLGIMFNEILGNCERISDYCSNIGLCVIESHSDEFNAHLYLNNMKHESKEFKDNFEKYTKKYYINAIKNN